MTHHDFEVDCEDRFLLLLGLEGESRITLKAYLMRKTKPTPMKRVMTIRIAILAPIGGQLEHLY